LYVAALSGLRKKMYTLVDLFVTINAIALVFFVENIDDEIRQKYEKIQHDSETNIDVETILIESGQ